MTNTKQKIKHHKPTIQHRFFILYLFIITATLSSLLTAEETTKTTHWQQTSKSGHLYATIYPQEKIYEFNRHHNWVIKLNDVSGKPITQAQIIVGGGMKSHGHGLPSSPKVTKELSDGVYLIEGVLFNMTGEWTLIFNAVINEKIDQFTFQIPLSH